MSIFNESQEQEGSAQADAGSIQEISQRMKSGANWFYWIAGLSLINSIVSIAGGNWNFIVGLGVTQIIDAIMQAISQESGVNAFNVVALMLDVLVAGVFVVFGYFAGRGSIGLFGLGMDL